MRWRRAAVVIPLVGVLMAGTPGVASASCNPGRPLDPYAGFAGTAGSATNVRAVEALIEEYHPFASSGSESIMWVMLNLGTSDWAQLGWWQNTSHWVFEQHTNGNGNWFTNFWAASPDSLTDYKVVKATNDHGGGVFNLYVDGALRTSVARTWAPNGYQLFGETHRKADQMAGGSTSLTTKANFYGPQYQNSAGTWLDVTTTAGVNNSNWYGAQRVSGIQGYYIWDKACAS